MALLGDIKNKEWSELAKFYAHSNSRLIPRTLYVGSEIGSSEDDLSDTMIDDWTIGENALMFFKVTSTFKSSDNSVCGIKGVWLPQPGCNITIDVPPEYCKLSWNPTTFSWNIIAKELLKKQYDHAFSNRGLDPNKKKLAYLDVPFGHVISGTFDIIDALDKKIPRLYSVPLNPLGRLGTEYSKKHILKAMDGDIYLN